MSKCGKGCMPECEYFTTGGCISPFNCLYKMETSYINTATSQTERGMMIMTDEEMIENLRCVLADVSEQCKQLQTENAALREKVSVVKRALREFAVQCGCDNCPFLGRCNISPDAKDDYQSCFDMYLSIAEKELAEKKKND